MSLFHVFIERPRSTAPSAVTALARAIAERYGIPAADLEGRLTSGRFRVKGNVDRATADTYAHDLARLGAVCTIVSADAPPPSHAAPVSLPRVERAPAPAPAPAAAPAPITASSVARISAAEIPQELGALSGEFPLTLSTLDGATEDEARASRKVKLPASFAPPDDAASASRKIQLPASFGPPPEDEARASRKVQLPASFGPPPDEDDDDSADVNLDDSSPAVEVFDPFAPPEEQGNAPELLLAVDRQPRKSKTLSDAPPPAAAAAAPAHPPATHATHAVEPAPRPAERAGSSASGPGWKGALRDDGVRLVAGAVLAVAIGAVPALLIGASRERAAFAQIDSELDKRQSEIRTSDGWDGLDRVRATFRERKHAERQSIAITSLMIWAALSGGFTWLWFRKIDWDRVLA